MSKSVKQWLRSKLKMSRDISSLKLGDISIEDGYAVMTQETLAYLLAVAEEKGRVMETDK